MIQTTYTSPVSKLLTLGEVRDAYQVDYLELGLTSEHIPELSRMSLDEDLLWADTESDEVWAPTHAWRALGALKDPAGVATLIDVMAHADEWENDWSTEEPPPLLAMIGEPAIEPLREFLADSAKGEWSRIAGINALEKIAQAHPEYRGRCVEILREQLRNFQPQDRHVNACIISSLTDIRAVDAAPEMAAAFAADAVDLSVGGDWEEIQIELGLLRERITPLPVEGWMIEEAERTDPEFAESIRETRRELERFAEGSQQISKEREQQQAEQRALDAQRNKRDQARKQAKQAKKKQRNKKKRKRK